MVGVAQSLRVARLGRSEHNGGVGEASDVLLRELTEALSMILGGLGARFRPAQDAAVRRCHALQPGTHRAFGMWC